MDRLDYLCEGYRQLSDTSFNEHIPEDLTEKHRLEVRDCVEGMYQDNELD